MVRSKISILILLILILGFLLRFYHLGAIPPSLDWDEASIGWNALNLLKTGSDEYGVSFPVSIRSFNDYKPSLYTYLTIFPVAMFGLTAFSVRLVSVFAGIFLIPGIGVLVWQTTKNKKKMLLAMFFIAFAPWAIQFGRVAFEAHLALVCSVWGIALLVTFLNSKRWVYCLVSALFFVSALYSYHSTRLVIPILFGLVLFKNFKTIIKNWKTVFLIGFISMILLLPLVRSSLRTGSLTTRFSEVNILNNPPQVVLNYLSHFDPRFLMWGDNNNRHHAPGIGPVLIVELVFICVALYKRKPLGVLAMMLLSAPSAAALTQESPHAVRAMLLFPGFTVLAAIGLTNLGKYRWIAAIGLIINLVFFLNQYFVQLPITYASSWQYGYKQLVEYVQENQKNFDKIRVTTAYDQPYIYFLFYTPVQTLPKNDGSFSQGFGKFEFSNVCPNNAAIKTLIVRTPSQPKCGGEILVNQINYPDGSPVFRIYKEVL